MTNFQKTFAEAVLKKQANRVGIDRADLAIVGYRPLDKYGVLASFAYTPSVGRITDRDLSQYVAAYIGNYHPITETLKFSEATGTFSVVISQYREARRLGDKEKMLPVIAGITYMDKTLGDMWNVQSGHNGEKHLVRISGEDINTILAERINRLRANNVNTVQHKACAALLTPNVTNLLIGDVIKFFLNGELLAGDITAFGEGTTVIVKPEGAEHTLAVDNQSILDIIQRSPNKGRMDSEELINYYANAYGNEEYARELVLGPDSNMATASTLNNNPYNTNPYSTGKKKD